MAIPFLRRGVLGLVMVVGVSAPWARADLDSDVAAVLAQPALAKVRAGVEIVRLGATQGQCETLFRHNAEQPLIPASNLKLVTTSAALAKLGAQFKFHTLLVRRGDDLILVGDGDPSFGDAQLLRKSGWDVTTVFADWAQALKKRNIQSVGKVLVDDSVFEELMFHPHWPVGQAQNHYEAEVGGMNLNLNCLDFYVAPGAPGQLAGFVTDPPTRYAAVRNQCVGGTVNAVDLTRQFAGNDIVLRGTSREKNEQPVSVTIHDPGLYAATVLAETLTGAGIHVSGPVGRDRTVRTALAGLKAGEPGPWELIAVHETPIEQALARANKDSVNLYAECLCKRLAFAVSGHSGSWTDGTAAVGAVLREIGVPAAEFRLDDGCGLSKDNAISANALVKVLTYDYLSANRQTFLDSLSVAGADGTLEKRFEGTDLRGRVMGKSGYVDMVSSLSGYLRARDDNWYVFSILFNGIPGGGKPLQEAIVRAIDNNVRARVAQGR